MWAGLFSDGRGLVEWAWPGQVSRRGRGAPDGRGWLELAGMSVLG